MMNIFVLSLLLVSAVASAAELDINEQRAKFNYQMACQGCHTGSGAGVKNVPELRDHIGYFLRSQQGREYLVRVPGSAYSVLSDANLAEVLNWMLLYFGGQSLSKDWIPYRAQEVGVYRQNPLNEVVQYRASLLESLAAISNQPSHDDEE